MFIKRENPSSIKIMVRNLKQAEEVIRELKRLKNYYEKISKEQQIQLDKQKDIINKINEITTQNTYGNLRSNYNKVKELVNDYKSNY